MGGLSRETERRCDLSSGFDQRSEHGQSGARAPAAAPVLIDRSSKIIIAVDKHLRTRDTQYPMVPRSERRPKAS